MADATETDRRRDEPCEDDQPPSKKLKTETGSPEKQVAGADSKDGEPSEDKDDEGHSSGKPSNTVDDPHVLLSQIREVDVGITEYISNHKGISAILKQRYSDFIVNEISETGEVVHLTNTDIPVVIEESAPDGPVDVMLPEDFLTQLKQVAGGSIPGLTASIPVDNDKEKRLHIHRAVKTAFPNLETKTEEKEGQKVITAMRKGKNKDQRRSEWPSSLSKVPYCRFVMFKENKGTMDMIHLIARSLKLKDSVFSYAGTKDKRGKTTQEVTAFRVPPKRLDDLNRFLHNLTLGNFRYVDKQLKLGELTGNRFTIVLRNVIGEDEDIDSGLNTLKSVGFINYYGLQRFGSFKVSTFQVGRALLREEWEEAVNLLILGDGGSNVLYRQVWRETRDAGKTLEALDYRNYIERLVLKSLQKRAKDFLGAINCLPRNMRLLYPHSFQSLVWNCMVSRRIKTFGLQPVVGDLVLPPDAVKEAASADIDMADAAKIEEDLDPKSTKVTPIVLDDSNLSQFSIYDVVLPLPGHSVIYPQNSVHTWYKEFMEEQGFDIDNMQRKQKDFSLPGGYRTIVVRPSDVEWKMFRYDDATVSLALSDDDRLQGLEEPQSVPDGKLRALRVSFNLPSSCYATMALRELLKTDTSPSQQATLNVT